jgi:hypothetical protein
MKHRTLLSIIVCGSAFAQTAFAQSGAAFAGVPVRPGGTVTANVPLDATQQRYVSEGGNAVPRHAIATLAVPRSFTPDKSWPVLVVISTSDFKRRNRDDLVQFYRDAALAEEWLLLAGDAPAPPRQDTSGWRAGTTLAALDALHRSFPGAAKWPVAIAGFSGGGKRAGTIAPLLSRAGIRSAGIFLTGVNEERLSTGYRQFQPGAAFLRTPIFLSSGSSDRVAPLTEQKQIKIALENAGFTNVRQQIFSGGHAVNREHVRAALQWFRTR